MKNSENVEKIYSGQYLPYIHKRGKIGNYLAVLMCFLPAIVVTAVYGIRIPGEAVMAGFASIASAVALVWIIDPIANFPIIGAPGTYLSSMAGNTSNMRVPCAVISQQAAEVQPGTPEGSIVATLGMCTSIFVNVPILMIGAALSSFILKALPPAVLDAFNYLLPALFGAIFIQFTMTKPKIAPIATIIGLVIVFMVRKGVFSFLGPAPTFVSAVVGVFGTIAVSLYLFKKGKIK